jgi:DNA-directed RNA polymerase
MPKNGKESTVKHEDSALLLWVTFKGLCIMNLYSKEKVSTNINTMASAGKCAVETIQKMEFKGLVSPTL